MILIPIGSWCRNTYQVNDFLKANGIAPISFPYDWAITPFEALKNTLTKDFNPENILPVDNISRNRLSSITDNNTQLILHHDFPHSVMKELESKGGGPMPLS